MIRFVVAVLFVSLAACATDDGNDLPQCDGASEGPVDMIFTYDVFNPPSLTCTENRTRSYCTGECCHPMSIMLSPTPIDCTGPCIGLDEAACIANTSCYMARDREAFEAGTESFRACYPLGSPEIPENRPCATRDVYGCARDGMCAGIYAQNATDPVFVRCADKAATMP